MSPVRTAVRTEPPASYVGPAGLDVEAAYRALESRDRRFDGRIWVGVTSTGIYCRPVCPAQTPKRANVRFFAAPAAAVGAGFRACKRCRPDSAPGTRQWDHRGDLAGQALRLIGEGAVDDGGVAGLAHRLHVTPRHLSRVLLAEVGATPLALALSRRAQTARMLVDQTALPLTDVAFAAGFSSIRQFNDVMRREFGCPPSQLRRTAAPELRADDPAMVLRLRFRAPYDAAAVGAFLAARAVPGLELFTTGRAAWEHRRVVRLPTAPAVVTVTPYDDHLLLRAVGVSLPDTAALVTQVRHWLDLDAEPGSVAAVLGADPDLAPLVAARPGLRVPTTVDAWETCVRAVVGQQVSVAAATTLLGRLVAAYGTAMGGAERASSGFPTAFPTPGRLAAAGPDELSAIGMPRARGRTLHALADATACGVVPIGSASREEILAALATIPGVGTWTLDYIALRALGDPDAFPATDLGIRHAARDRGLPSGARELTSRAEAWRPWRAYAAQHLWSAAPHDSSPTLPPTTKDRR
jgi:AraC family transcriptional regulator of adaptative response / DNA-3-methyladenine glycosylase II